MSAINHPILHPEALRALRLYRRFSMRRLAENSGVPQNRIWKIENALTQARDEEALRLWNALSTGGSK